jgi:hypothetical protein
VNPSDLFNVPRTFEGATLIPDRLMSFPNHYDIVVNTPALVYAHGGDSTCGMPIASEDATFSATH